MDSLEMNPLADVKELSVTFGETESDQNISSYARQTASQDLSGATAGSNSDALPVNTVNEALTISTATNSQFLDNVDDKSNSSANKAKNTSCISATTDVNVAPAGQGNVLAKVEDIRFAESQTSAKIVANTTEICDQKIKSITVDSSNQNITLADIHMDVSEGKQSGSFHDASQPLTSDVKGSISFEEKSVVKNNPETSGLSGPSNIASETKVKSIADIISKFQKGDSCNEVNKQTEDPVVSPQTPTETKVKNEKAEMVLSKKTDVEKDEIESPISLKDLEQSFLSALNMACISANEPLKSEIIRKTSTGSAPTIKITEICDVKQEFAVSEYSDIEAKNDDRTTVVEDSKTNNPIVRDEPSNMELKDANVANAEESNPTTSVPKSERNESDDNKDEERKAFFYLSSSDLPPELNYQSSQELDVLRYRPSANPVEFRGSRQSNRSGSSWFCSKSVHGVIFLAAFIVSLFGYILYNMAIEGKVPDVFESVGLTTAIVACIIGVISLVCFSILGAFPTLPVVEYRRIGDAESLGSRSRIANPQSNIDDESWSSEMERAFRRQNGMAAARTSENLLSMLNDRQTLIEKTEKLKNQVTGFLESFIDVVSQMDPVEDLTEMRPVIEDADEAISQSVSPRRPPSAR